MAYHKSAKKRIKTSEKKRVQNKYYSKTARNSVAKLRSVSKKAEGEEMLPKVVSILDKLAKGNVIHKKKADNLKSKLTKHVTSLK